MNRRTNIINALIDHLTTSGVVLAPNIIRRLVFLHEVNDYPAICFTAGNETRFHYGANSRLAQLSINLRAFTHGEDSIDVAERYARDIETALDSYAESNFELGVHDARVLSLRTDEGLFDPYGIIDMTIQITYEVLT